VSYGAGRAILLQTVPGSPAPIALISTTTQRAGQDLVAKTSFVFEGCVSWLLVWSTSA
jgi:hypothetical protein